MKSIEILHKKLAIFYRNSGGELVAFPRNSDGKLAESWQKAGEGSECEGFYLEPFTSKLAATIYK